jgi:hypothetical protein
LLPSIIAFTVKSAFGSSLTSSRVDELRSQYPLYLENPHHINMIEPNFNQIIEHSDGFVLAEVIEQLPEYEVNLIDDTDTSEGKIFEKGKEFGLRDTATFIQYKIRLIEEITGDQFIEENEPSTEIIISVNSEFEGYIPELKPGMKIVTSIKRGEGKHEGKYGFSKYGFYYVTDSGHVLSAYNESKNDKFTGKKLEILKAKIKEKSRV